MEYIRLNKIKKVGNHIEYDFDASDANKKFFNDYKYYVEYPDNIESVPEGIAVIPFLTNMLQIMWLSDSELIIDEIDRSFFECIPNIKHGFEEMYPLAKFKGRLIVNRVVDYSLENFPNSAVFYSGGLDSAVTMLRHLDRNLQFISIWGSDVDCENDAGWKIVEQGIKEIANQFSLESATIRSSFRRFDNVQVLTNEFKDVLGTPWWYGVKHGIGIIGHAAPYAWLHGIGKIYIASSNCVKDGKQKCASDPTIDNCVRFFGAEVIHDAFELTRQDKMSFLIDTCRKMNTSLKLHVCWKSQTGNNCCECEKCYRTMVGLWAEGADPIDFGFEYDSNTFKRIYQLVALRYKGLPGRTWTYIKQSLLRNWDILPSNIKRGLKWILQFDFLNEENNKCRIRYMRSWHLKKRIVNMFPGFYKAYIKIRGYEFE